jgi:hypothetical protein
MGRIITAVAAASLVAATVVIIWPRFVQVKLDATTTVTTAQAAAVTTPMILPLVIMIEHGKNLQVEQWDAF